MDYSPSGTKLYKHQWDYVHDPERMISWFEDDEESEFGPCLWFKDLYSYFWPDANETLINERSELFETVNADFNEMINLSKEDNFVLDDFEGWSIRKASYQEKMNKTLVERVMIKLVEEDAPSFNLWAKGIFLGTYNLEDKDYNIALYSESSDFSIEKVIVEDVCDLRDNDKVRVLIKDKISISFFDNGSLKMTLQINSNKTEDAEKWLKYMGILVKSPSWTETVLAYWNNFLNSSENNEDGQSCESGFCCTICGKDLTINLNRLKDIFPNSTLIDENPNYANLFNTALQTTNFNTCDRQAKIFAQIGHESWNFNATTEGQYNGHELEWSLNKILTYFNLTSGAKRHWFNQDFWNDGSYKEFITVNYYEETENEGTHKSESTQDYYGIWNGQNQPQYHIEVPTGFIIEEDGDYKIYTVPPANKTQYRKNIFRYAYGGVLGNEDPDNNANTEDGWNYRGKGAIQLTGKDNYRRNQDEILKWFNQSYNLINNPDLVSEDPTVIVYSSVAYILQNVSKIEDIDGMTIDQFSALVNTGNSNNSIDNVNGAEDRRNRYNNLIQDENLFKCNDE